MAILCVAICGVILAAPAVALCGELVQGGDFETGGFTGAWVHGAGSISGPMNPDWADHMVVLDLPYAGNYSALLGFKYANLQQKRYAFMYQDVAIPSGISSATLHFKFRQQGFDGLGNDPFRVTVRNLSGAVLATVVEYAFPERDFQFKDSGWIDDDGAGPTGYDMTPFAGQTVRIYFRQENGNDNTYETWIFVDDVSLVFSRYVDLAVDGDGDDLFGDPGTGDGGTSVQSGEGSETITYSLDVENEGPAADSYVLSASPPPGWSILLRYGGMDFTFPWTTPPVPAGSVLPVEVLVTVPAGTSIGGYATIVDAVSAAFADRFDSAKLVTNVVPASHLADMAIDGDGFGAIDPAGGGGVSYAEGDPSTDVTYQLELLNAGVAADSFILWFRPEAPLTAGVEEGAIVHAGAFATGAVNAGASVSYDLRVTIPASLLGGDYTTFVYAKSLTDTLKKDGVRAVTRVRAPAVDVVICGSGAEIVDPTGSGLGGSATIAGTRGNTVYFPFTIRNEGWITDSFALSWDGLKGAWSATVYDGVTHHPLPWVTPTIGPKGEQDYFLAVTIPGNAAFGTYASILDAASQADGNVTESVTAAVNVSSGLEEVDLIIDGAGEDVYGPLGTGLGGSSALTVSPGDTVYFTITVQNEGGENLFDLSWNAPPGWEVLIGDSTATLRRITAGTYTLEVRVPASCAGGTFDVVIDGWKTNKPYFIDSVRGRIVVTPPRVVDAIIDGDGDEVFGALGTGGGGFSTRSTSGGETAQFKVELENQGGAAESYTVSWNAVSGLSAVFGGSASPFTTAAVAAGGSAIHSFAVTVPAGTPPGDYDYFIDVVSTVDPGNVESVTARVHVGAPPQIDLVIDGDGGFVTAPAGSGGGGGTIVFGAPGALVTAALEVANRGGSPDSFRITWSDPTGWPAGSVLVSDGVADHASPFVTGLIAPGASASYTVRISIPANAPLQSTFLMDGVSLTTYSEDSIILEVGTGCIIRGTVFDDVDHDGVLDPGESGWVGVTVRLTDPAGDMETVTGPTAEYLFEAAAGAARRVIEINPSGMVSVSPDTVDIGAPSPGDTVTVDFADVRCPMIAPVRNVNGPAGGFVDLAHSITAGTSGQAVLTIVVPSGWIEARFRDNNGDGLLDPGDTPLTAADLDLDPAVPGSDVVPIIVRVFIPPPVPAGTVEAIVVTVVQTLRNTAIMAEDSVTDQVLVLASASGQLNLVKDVDVSEARPGDVITYTITFTNPGTDDVREIEIIDPISAEVDLVLGAFGPGLDITWVRGGVPVYLTADPSDADEAMLMPDGTLHVLLSRRAPFVLGSGKAGEIVYRVRIR